MDNRAEVLLNVESLIRQCESTKTRRHSWHRVYGDRYEYRTFNMYDVCDKLSIFDWWKNELSYSQLKQMRSFLKVAGQLGYNGYVCFKVGMTGCANGMWAYKKESTTGQSPDGEFLYRSFTPDYVTWDAMLPDDDMASRKKQESTGEWKMTLAELKDIMKGCAA